MQPSRIMIVDDTRTDLKYLECILSNEGYLVTTATSGEEAINKAQREKPDLIFLDIIMERMDGYEICRTLKKNQTTSTIPIVFVTGKSQKTDQRWAAIQGAGGFITKPATPCQIIEEINRQLIAAKASE